MHFFTNVLKKCASTLFHIKKSHPFDILSVRKKTRMLSYESKFSRHMRSMDNAAEHFMFLNGKVNLGSKIRAQFLLLNILISVEKKIRLLRLTEIPWSFPGKLLLISTKPRRPPGGTCVNFCWVCAASLSEPLPHYSLFCGQL